jgi:hypothetical protein
MQINAVPIAACQLFLENQLQPRNATHYANEIPPFHGSTGGGRYAHHNIIDLRGIM